MVFDGLFELAIVWLMASGIFVSKLIEGGTKFLIVVSVRFHFNKVSNPNYKRNEKQWNLCLQKKTDSVVFFHRNFCVE